MSSSHNYPRGSGGGKPPALTAMPADQIIAQPLTPAAFTAFGDVLDAQGDFRLINNGFCQRFDDRAKIDVAHGQPGISIFHAQPRSLPYSFDLIERHPLGSQAFIPMTAHPFLIIVACSPAETPCAFLTNGSQGINLHRGIWHGVLTPLHAPGLFAVIDRIGDGANLEEHRYAAPWVVTA
jgi:ureidoglycolate lyase